MRGADVLALHRRLSAAGLTWCLSGGWGVDALVGRQTRPHHDLDVLIARPDLPAILDLLRSCGYRHAHTWPAENLPLPDDRDGAGTDSAFVMADGANHAVDIHVYRLDGDQVRPLWADDRTWPREALAATGVIEGQVVTCLTARAQLEFHTGYDLPPIHRQDLRHLDEVLRRDG